MTNPQLLCPQCCFYNFVLKYFSHHCPYAPLPCWHPNHPKIFLNSGLVLTRKSLLDLAISHSLSRGCSAYALCYDTNPGTLPMSTNAQLSRWGGPNHPEIFETIFHRPCAWSYLPCHLLSSGDALRLSCSLAQALTPVECATDFERLYTNI